MINRCRYCKHTFPSSKALGQHVKTKHFKNYLVPYIALVAVVIIGIVIAVMMVPSSSVDPTTAESENSILERTISSHNSLRQHFHPEIKITVDGEPVKIPANVGVSGGTFRYMHTHDDSGKIHVESPSNHIFTIGDFFTIWGKEFTSECVDTNCGKIVVSVNGDVIDSPTDYILEEDDKVLIEVSTN